MKRMLIHLVVAFSLWGVFILYIVMEAPPENRLLLFTSSSIVVLGVILSTFYIPEYKYKKIKRNFIAEEDRD